MEGAPAFGEARPFAGRCGDESLGRSTEDGGSIQPSGRTTGDAVLLGASEWLYEKGNLRPRRSAAAERLTGGPLLGTARPTQSSAMVQRPPTQSVAGSGSCPQAASGWSDGFSGRNGRGVLAAPRSRPGNDCRGSRPSRAFFERGRSARSKGRGERDGSSRGAHEGVAPPDSSRELGPRGCVRAS